MDTLVMILIANEYKIKLSIRVYLISIRLLKLLICILSTITLTAHSNDDFTCEQCPRVYKSQKALSRHRRSHNYLAYSLICSICGKYFHRKDMLNRHKRRLDHQGLAPKTLRKVQHPTILYPTYKYTENHTTFLDPNQIEKTEKKNSGISASLPANRDLFKGLDTKPYSNNRSKPLSKFTAYEKNTTFRGKDETIQSDDSEFTKELYAIFNQLS